MQKGSFYIVNGITFYRLVAAPCLLFLILYHQPDLFKWLLMVSFLTDAIDGILARKHKVTSRFGARMDSLADDLTVLVAIIALFVLERDFMWMQKTWWIPLLILYLAQLALALIRYGKPTSFHTYSAKIAAVAQAIFLVLFFFLSAPPVLLFRIAVLLTALNIVEEILMVLLLPHWKADVRGIFQLLQKKDTT